MSLGDRLTRMPGLRTRVDASQIPSPIEAIEIDRQQWENEAFMTLPGKYVPRATSDFVAIDQGEQSSLLHTRRSPERVPCNT